MFAITQSLAKEFLEQMNEFHTYYEPFDTPLQQWLNELYGEELKIKNKMDYRGRYFSPSGADKTATELFAKAKRFKKDDKRLSPHQRRYMAQGTALGDWLQYEVLLCERHFEKLTGKKPRFVMGLKDGKPAFEEFVAKTHPMEWDGQKFNLNGMTDGIMIDTHTGEPVILEAKSKQNTPSKTSLYSMKEANPGHVKQTVCYGEMYGVDRAIIVYINGAKEGWFADEEKLRKTPDLRAFDVEFTDELKEEVFGHFADTCRIIDSGRMPIPDLRSWEFSEYKDAITKRLTDQEFEDTIRVAEIQLQMEDNKFVSENIRKAIHDIKRRREALQ